MKKIADSLLRLSRDVMLQLVDILTLIMLMLAELKPRKEICVECINIANHVLSVKSKLLMLSDEENNWRCNLKLGLVQLNTTVERSDTDLSFRLLKICCCIFYIKTEQYAECVECLGTSQPADIELSFVENYMKGKYNSTQY
jgi:hypothetical protein